MPVVRLTDETLSRLHNHSTRAFQPPDEVLRGVLDQLDGYLGKTAPAPQPDPAPSRKLDKTPQKAFREPLLRVLWELNGVAPVAEIRDALRSELSNILKDDDYVTVSNGDESWWNSVCWERSRLIKEGMLSASSPRGVWALSDAGLAYGAGQPPATGSA